MVKYIYDMVTNIHNNTYIGIVYKGVLGSINAYKYGPYFFKYYYIIAIKL